MRTTWIKAIRGALAERGRAVVAIAAIALGLSGFFAVLATYAILFIVKFVLFDRLVFAKPAAPAADPVEARTPVAT